MKKKKPQYFDPFIYQKCLEDTMLSPIAKEILKPQSVSLRHKFLFDDLKKKLKERLQEEQRFIESIVEEELYHRLDEIFKYIGIGEKDKQQWFDHLREEFNLPADYKFE
ncbi:hypothetical protein ACS9SB_0022040 [Bacillus subtilis]|uniref:hypothetical protein n=1 Tax=Bacillus cabrialesii TaxID=2487276 RepID=UPI003CEF67C9